MLIEAGADIDALSAPDSGGAPSSTALGHAAVFGMTEVLDVLVAAGARIDSLEMAAAAGDITGWPRVKQPAHTQELPGERGPRWWSSAPSDFQVSARS